MRCTRNLWRASRGPYARATRPHRTARGAATRPRSRWGYPGTRAGLQARARSTSPRRGLLPSEASCPINRDKLTRVCRGQSPDARSACLPAAARPPYVTASHALHRVASGSTTPLSTKAPHRRFRTPPPFPGRLHEPHCTARVQATQAPEALPPPAPLPRLFRRGRPWRCTPRSSAARIPPVPSRGWVGLGHLCAHGHPTGAPWRPCACPACEGDGHAIHRPPFHGTRVVPETLGSAVGAWVEGVASAPSPVSSRSIPLPSWRRWWRTRSMRQPARRRSVSSCAVRLPRASGGFSRCLRPPRSAIILDETLAYGACWLEPVPAACLLERRREMTMRSAGSAAACSAGRAHRRRPRGPVEWR